MNMSREQMLDGMYRRDEALNAHFIFKLKKRPGSAEIASHMAPFKPYRSLATHHIWMHNV